MSAKDPKDANYDPHLTSAETAAREEREQENFKQTPDTEGDAEKTSGYTVDREGLANNYAVEPEMYVEERGDLREKEATEKTERAEELKEVKEQGTKGPGVI